MALLYLPVAVVVPFALLNFAADLGNQHLLGTVVPSRQPWRYRIMLALVFVLEATFLVPPALIWQLDDPFAKAFAVGVVSCAMIHLATMRSIHLRVGLTGFAASATMIFGSNALLWLPGGQWTAFIGTTLAAIGGLAYGIGAMITTHRLHATTAERQAEAQEANTSKGRFLTQMSHELRTPLNAILGMGHAELARSTDAVGRERLSVLIASAEGLSTMLDDILDLTVLQEGQMPVRPRPVDPIAELRSTVDLFRPSIELAGLELRLDMSDGLPARAMLDPQRVRQCVSNLMSNAVRHTAQGGIRVLVERDMAGATPQLRVTVADSGRGVPQDQRDAVFEPFGRSAEMNLAGRGIGLSISRGLARKMGGDLMLVFPGELGHAEWQAHGGGACFVLTLPLADTEMTIAPLGPDRPLAGRLVLVVDDIATNRMVASGYLTALGADVLEAASGATALAMLRGTLPDIVLLDMNMPDMNGVEVMRCLRALPGPAASLPVIAVTADTMEDQRRLYMQSGLDGYLVKPLRPDVMAAELTRHLRPRHAV